MSKFSVGDVIKNKKDKVKIKLVFDDVVGFAFIFDNKETQTIYFYNEQYLIDNGYELAEKGRFVPKMEERYVLIGSCGDETFSIYRNSGVDEWRINTGNCFHPDDKEGLEGYRLKLLELGK